MFSRFVATIALLVACCFVAVNAAPGDFGDTALHFALKRRGGAFAHNRTADLDLLSKLLAGAESRFNTTQREVRGNKIVRAPKIKGQGGEEATSLMGEIGKIGNWFATLRLGEQKQHIEADVDMLSADFAITSTSSSAGTRFAELFSSSYVEVRAHPFPGCNLAKDNILLPRTHQQFPLSFPHCKPSKQSLGTLGASGGILGLSPSASLRQIDAPAFIQQLLDANLIEHDVFSITLINGEEGILSVGGTVAESMAVIDERIQKFLGKSSPAPVAEQVQDAEQDAADLANGATPELLAAEHDQQFPTPEEEFLAALSEELPPSDAPGLLKRDIVGGPAPGLQKRDVAEEVAPLMKRARKPKPIDRGAPSWADAWKWSPVEGAEGWWQILMRGVWTDGVKVLKNQPAVIDISTPFILAPPQAAKQFYSSISGSRRLPAPYSQFYAFPCNNPPFVHVEFGGWRFPAMRGMKDHKTTNGPNGKFSLGKVRDESGYCVGAIVETRMGVGDMAPIKKGHSRKEDNLRGLGPLESGMLAGNGMRDSWVLGEPIFRGIGIVFDMKVKQVGFRSY